MSQASAGGAAHNAMVVTRDHVGDQGEDAEEPPDAAPDDESADEAEEGSDSDGVG